MNVDSILLSACNDVQDILIDTEYLDLVIIQIGDPQISFMHEHGSWFIQLFQFVSHLSCAGDCPEVASWIYFYDPVRSHVCDIDIFIFVHCYTVRCIESVLQGQRCYLLAA